MPKEFLKSLLMALGLHGCVLGLFLLSWPYLAHSVFSFDRYRIFKVSLVSGQRLTETTAKETPGKKLSAVTKMVEAERSSSRPMVPMAERVAQQEEQSLTAPEEKKESGPGLSITLRAGQPGEIIRDAGGRGGESHTGRGRETLTSLSFPSQGTASASSSAIPRYGQNRPPYYPSLAREQGWQGTTMLKVLVLKNGSVGSSEILHSSGFVILDQSAQKGVKEWKFTPGLRDGHPVDMWVQIPVTFRLE